MASVLRTSCTARRTLSPGRGPMVPKMGSMWNFVAACTTACSASSCAPMPAVPSSTTTPPLANGLPSGAGWRGADKLIVWSLWWILAWKPPPSISWTFAIPAHVLTRHRSMTLSWSVLGPLLEATAPPNGWSYQGKQILFPGVTPTSTAASFFTGWKTGMGGLDLPFNLAGASALKITSVLHRFFVPSSQRMPSLGAWLMRLAAKFTQSPSTVYSSRRAQPTVPQ
mmetsp:Transcript_48811/g.139667  ORF Transcript_48811/g.139667 Transcript_48811/m.139667 type:complete len:225 (-) Transcript_48811:1364-2038(-)